MKLYSAKKLIGCLTCSLQRFRMTVYIVFQSQIFEKRLKNRVPSSFWLWLVWVQILTMRHQYYPRVDNALMYSSIKQKMIWIFRKNFMPLFLTWGGKDPFFPPGVWGGSFRILKGLCAMKRSFLGGTGVEHFCWKIKSLFCQSFGGRTGIEWLRIFNFQDKIKNLRKLTR